MKKKLTFINPVSWGGVLDHTYRLTNYFKYKNKIEIIKIKSEISKQKKNSFNKSNIIILQYSGYGFSNIGAPFWLLKEINNLKKKNNKIIIIFHELYAVSYYPWKSIFFYQFLQKYVFKRLLKSSDYALVSTKKHFNKWSKINGIKKTIYLPTFSNVGEMTKFKYKRDNILVVFGLSHSRANTYRKFGTNLFQWAKNNKILIIDIGPKIIDQDILKNLKVHNVKMLGLLKNKEINKIFNKTKYGLLDYNLEIVDKSGIFNAYAAYGIIPIMYSERKNFSIVRKNFHYLLSLPKSINKNKHISKNIWSWYQKHNLIKSSIKISNLF